MDSRGNPVGSFGDKNTGATVVWQAPEWVPPFSWFYERDGEVTIRCTMKDDAVIPPGETGDRNDTDVVRAVTIKVWQLVLSDVNGALATWLPANGNTIMFQGTYIPDTVSGYITFILPYDTVSTLPGTSMNYGTTGNAYDLKFPAQSGFDPPYNNDLEIKTSSAVTAKQVTVLSQDWASYGAIKARGQVGGLTYETPTIGMPVDTNGNHIPDFGYTAYDDAQVDDPGAGAGGDDNDANPQADNNDPQQGRTGDGLAAFEEYRGFVVNGQHRRLNPERKDVFIHSEFDLGIGYAANLPTATHEILNTEWNANRVVNFNYDGNVPHNEDQHGIRVVKLYISQTGRGLYGETFYVVGTPNQVDRCEVYYAAVREVGPPTMYTTDNDGDGNVFPPEDTQDTTIARDTQDAADERGIQETIAHEVGHALHIDHYDYDPGNPGHLTVMVRGFLAWANADWTNIPSTYDAVDEGQIRVH